MPRDNLTGNRRLQPDIGGTSVALGGRDKDILPVHVRKSDYLSQIGDWHSDKPLTFPQRCFLAIHRFIGRLL
jgi:hypothetical protein